MRLISKMMSGAVAATVLMSGVAQAHTVGFGAQAASSLMLVLAACREHAASVRSFAQGDLSRSPEQLRRLALQSAKPRHGAGSAMLAVALRTP